MKNVRVLTCMYLLLLSGLEIMAQSASFFDSRSGQLTCAWETVGLREAPGKKGKYLSRVHFGEKVQQLGEEAYIPEEKRTYVKVESADGKVGWVHEYLFVPNGEAAVVLDDGRIYKRPNTPSTITPSYFSAGEMVILQSEVGGWVSLVGKRKSREGWIKDSRKVSTATEDVEFATLMGKIQAEKDAGKRNKQMDELLSQARKVKSPLTQIIASASSPETRPTDMAATARTLQKAPTSIAPPRTTQRPDHLSGDLRAFRQEVGTIYQMKPIQRMRTDFYGAHPSLPMGTKVRIAVPENSGFVEVEIVARASNRTQAMLGLPPACIEALFGDDVPRQVEILY